MPTATSIDHEKLVQCDVSELKVPTYTDDLIRLTGASASQITFAAQMRNKKLEEWGPDLPVHVLNALRGISDGTWWLANKDKDSSNIGWPQSWTDAKRNRTSPPPGQSSLFEQSHKKAVDGVFDAGGNSPLGQFEAFARKACQSPELSYLAMMALMYRQTKDATILAKFKEARDRVQGHLDAIDEILGVSTE